VEFELSGYRVAYNPVFREGVNEIAILARSPRGGRPFPNIFVSPADIITSSVTLEGRHIIVRAEAGVNSADSRGSHLEQTLEERRPCGLRCEVNAAISL
jgi:hypothetical protein